MRAWSLLCCTIAFTAWTVPALAIEERDKPVAHEPPAVAPTGATGPAESAWWLEAILELRAPEVPSGTPILVRVGLRSRAAKPLSFREKPPWRAVTISVTGPTGERLFPLASDLTDFASTRSTTIAPGAAWYAAWDLSQWSDLSHWGYRLSTPGRYVLTAQPNPGEGYVYDFLAHPASAELTVLPAPPS